MNKKINKVLSGIAIGALSASACIIPVTGSFAGEINQNGIYGCGANTSGSLGILTISCPIVSILTIGQLILCLNSIRR